MIATMPSALPPVRRYHAHAPQRRGAAALLAGALACALAGGAFAVQSAPVAPGGAGRPAAQRGSDPKSIEIPGPIKAEPSTVDFGVVEPGATVAATIKLINPLDRDVTISAAKPSCTCTTIDMVGKVIPAGGSIEMPMSMKMAHTPGAKTAVVNMAFAGVTQVMVLKLEAETAYAVRATPAFVDALTPARMAGSIELVARDGLPFTVKSVDGEAPVTGDGSPMKPATKHTLRYDFTSASPLTKVYNAVPPFLVIETDHPKCPIVDMRVRHETTRITPSLAFAEFRANCGAIPPKGSAEFEIEIKLMGSSRIDSVQSLHPSFKTEAVAQKPDDSSVLVTVRVTDLGAQPGVFLFPCRFSGRGKQSDFWVFGVVR